MAIIDENGMSYKLVEFCNQNKTFKNNFVALFTEQKNITSIEFTGFNETGFGKPDITINFSDNSVFYIEVKTKITTGFQENQVTSKTGYAKLIKTHNQKIENSLGYLLDNFHNTEECLVDNIIYWQDVLNLVKDFNNTEFAKDIIQNVDGISTDEKLFGSDEELFSNPFQLAVFNNEFLRREEKSWAKNWIFDTFLIPSLENLGCKDIKEFAWNDFDGNPSIYVEFKYDKKEIHLQFNHTQFWENSTADKWIGDYYFSSFTFYRPWIVGVRTATSENQLQKLTEKAVRLWFKDFDNIINGNSYFEDEDYYSIGYLGQKAEVYGNPIVLSNMSEFLYEATDIYDDLVIPALKKIPEIKIKDKNYYINKRRSIKFEYGNQVLAINVFGFLNLQTEVFTEHHSFAYYRPWIVGVHKSKNVEEMVDFTLQALQLWFEDLSLEDIK